MVPLKARRARGHESANYGIQGIDGEYVGSEAGHGEINIGCVTAG
jgi:hypothetical protein